MDFESLDKYILSFADVSVSYPYGKDIAVYSVSAEENEPMMFALLDKKLPLRLSVKCDPKLSVILREKYESVMPGQNLNQKFWNTILLTGQLPLEDIHGFITHSYILTAEPSS